MQAMQRLCYIFAYTHVYVHNMCTYTICVRTQYMICTYRLYNRYRNLDACLHAKTRIEWKCPETCASEFAHTYAISYIWDSMYVHKYSIPRHMMQRRGTWYSIPRHMMPRNIPRSYMGWLRCIPRHEVIWGGYDAFRGMKLYGVATMHSEASCASDVPGMHHVPRMCLGTWCIPRHHVSEVHRNIPRHHVSEVHDAAPLLQGGEDS